MPSRVTVKRGKDEGMMRKMEVDKLLKTLPVLQTQVDALLDFEVTADELRNGVINGAFLLLFKVCGVVISEHRLNWRKCPRAISL